MGSLASSSARNFYFTLGLYPILPLKGRQPLHNLNQLKERESCGIISHEVTEIKSIREIHGAQKNLTDSPERFREKITLPPCNPHFSNGSLPREKARGKRQEARGKRQEARGKRQEATHRQLKLFVKSKKILRTLLILFLAWH